MYVCDVSYNMYFNLFHFDSNRFYKMRAERIEWFSNRNPFAPEIDELLDLGVFLPLREKDSNGCQIFVIRTGIHNTKRHAQNDVLKVRCIYNKHKPSTNKKNQLILDSYILN